MSETKIPAPESQTVPQILLRLSAVLLLLYGFLIAIRLMGSSIKALGSDTATELFNGVANPFAGLAVGILATVLVQSSSTSTSTIVGLVGQAGPAALKLSTAIPMVMGANIGTTVTNTIVSIGHVRQGGVFRRAFAAATVHDFFNLLCVAIILPIEIATGFLEKSAGGLSSLLAGRASGGKMDSPIKGWVKAGSKVVEGALEGLGLEGGWLSLALVVTGLFLTFFCLILITRNMRVMISGPMERALNGALGRSGILGILVGIGITVAVQSSSITTSLMVPMCAAGVLTLENAFPIMIGANIGTTATALLASLATDQRAGLTIALVHLLFNVIGMLLFFPIPALRRIPISLARRLAIRAQRNPMWVLAYVLGTFVILPLLGYLLLR